MKNAMQLKAIIKNVAKEKKLCFQNRILRCLRRSHCDNG